MTQKNTAGFIATDRGVFDHPALRKPERFRAWLWLVAQAAWKAEGRRGTWGVVHLERGEIATSTRLLAAAWRWPQSNVRCFLDRLERDGMITVTKTRSATRSPTGPLLEHEISIVRICNYDKFQSSSTAPKDKPAQQPAQRPAELSAQTGMFPGFCEPLTTKPLNQEQERKGHGDGEEKRTAPTAPRHGTRSMRNGTVFILRASDEWQVYAQDYKATRGAEPLPNRHGGYWFYWLGEEARPAKQRGWRDPNAFGAAARQGGRS